MRTRLVIAWLALVAACASPAPVAPGTTRAIANASGAPALRFVDRLPAGTWMVARANVTPSLVDAAMAHAGLPTAAAAAFSVCDLELEGIQRVDAALSPPANLLVEVHGSIRVAQLACVFGLEVGADGSVRTAGMVATDSADGIIVRYREGDAVPSAGGQLPEELIEAYEQLDPAVSIALLATLGPTTAPFQVLGSVAASPSDADRLQLRVRLASDETARALYEWMTDSLAEGGAAGLWALAAIQPRLDGVDIHLGFDASPQLALALSAIAQPFGITSASMAPTIVLGDQVFVGKGTLAGRARRGEVVAFLDPTRSTIYLKRVIAIGGDRLRSTAGTLELNGVPLAEREIAADYAYDDAWPEGHTSVESGALWSEELDGFTYFVLHVDHEDEPDFDVTVPRDQVFVLGDNRGNSMDSRYYGPIPTASILGRAKIVAWSTAPDDGLRWDRVGGLIDAPAPVP